MIKQNSALNYPRSMLSRQLIYNIIQYSMSEVIEDLDIGSTNKIPYYFLNNTLQLGIFSSKSTVSYSDHQIRILTRDELDSCYELITKIVARKAELSLQSTLMKNAKYFVIDSAELRKIFYRSFVKTTFEPRMKILINQQGLICFKMHTFLTSQLEFHQSKQVPKIYKFIERVYTQMIESFHLTFEKLKLILEPTYEKRIYQNPDRLERLDIMKNTCRFTYVQPSFMKSNGKRGKLNHENLPVKFISESELSITNFYDLKVQSDKINDDLKCSLFVELWQETYKLQKVQDACLYKNFNLPKIKDLYQTNLKGPQIKKKPQQTTRIQFHQDILANITIIEPEKIQWTKMYEGGFGILYKASVSFHYTRQNYKTKSTIPEKPIQKVMVLKSDKVNTNSKVSRIDVEKLILGSLKGKKSRYLPKFFETHQKVSCSSNFIITDFYPQKSLDHWFKNFGEFTSIFTKFSLLIYVCYGLYFLHQNSIIHRDLKTSNILIDNRMMAKITDFGQSYHFSIEEFLKQQNSSLKPGITLPYCPPEIFFKSDKYITEPTYDMFSFGFVIFEIVFGRGLFSGVKDAGLKKIYLKQAHNIMGSKQYHDHGKFRSLIKQRIYLAAQQLSYYGPAQILSPILNVIQRCLDPKIENRPHLEWVLAIIKQIYNSLLDFYHL